MNTRAPINLVEYIQTYARRGACTCGQYVDAPVDAKEQQPTGHTCDVIFFKVAAVPGADKDQLIQFIKTHEGHYCECDPLDGKEHNYVELGGWLGDQELALMLIGLGAVLDVWKALTPATMLGLDSHDPLAQMMVGQGFVALKVQNVEGA